MTAIFQDSAPKRPKARPDLARWRWARLSLTRVPLAGQIVLANLVVLAVVMAGILAVPVAQPAQIWLVFAVAVLVCIALSLALATAITRPLAALAAAAEIGRVPGGRTIAPGRVWIPDLSARPDEIGRLSVALRGMVTALCDRIDANEHFAADVSHEIKNPLASLRSAVGALRMITKAEQREKLLDVIEHDVRRLDRLVSDISSASRLESDLVKEEEEAFNLRKTLISLTDHLSTQAQWKGVDLITDFPDQPLHLVGIEARLAQVFVNLITNAISFCAAGDAVRIWARRRDNRVLEI